MRPCECTGYQFWYQHEVRDLPVCRCGHIEDDHLDRRLSCLEDVYDDRLMSQTFGRVAINRGTP